MYEYGALSRLLGTGANPSIAVGPVCKLRVLYARVSSAQQSDDLERQKAALVAAYPGYKLYSDIGSGLNWKRRAFLKLVDQVIDGRVSEIVVARRDRLCRFGLELLEHIFAKTGTKFIVTGSEFQAGAAGQPAQYNNQAELAEDLLAIVNVFVAKSNGLRGAAQSRERRNLIKLQAASPGTATTQESPSVGASSSGQEVDCRPEGSSQESGDAGSKGGSSGGCPGSPGLEAPECRRGEGPEGLGKRSTKRSREETNKNHQTPAAKAPRTTRGLKLLGHPKGSWGKTAKGAQDKPRLGSCQGFPFAPGFMRVPKVAHVDGCVPMDLQQVRGLVSQTPGET